MEKIAEQKQQIFKSLPEHLQKALGRVESRALVQHKIHGNSLDQLYVGDVLTNSKDKRKNRKAKKELIASGLCQGFETEEGFMIGLSTPVVFIDVEPSKPNQTGMDYSITHRGGIISDTYPETLWCIQNGYVRNTEHENGNILFTSEETLATQREHEVEKVMKAYWKNPENFTEEFGDSFPTEIFSTGGNDFPFGRSLEINLKYGELETVPDKLEKFIEKATTKLENIQSKIKLAEKIRSEGHDWKARSEHFMKLLRIDAEKEVDGTK